MKREKGGERALQLSAQVVLLLFSGLLLAAASFHSHGLLSAGRKSDRNQLTGEKCRGLEERE